MSWSSILIPTKACCSKKKSDQALFICHPGMVTTGDQLKNGPCCENQVGFLKMTSDFIQFLPQWVQHYALTILWTHPATNFLSGITPDAVVGRSSQSHASAISLYGRSLLIFKNVFQI
ncbi:MAG: hypothetical protein ABIQ02_01140 [Saprospiraceae bacterium]